MGRPEHPLPAAARELAQRRHVRGRDGDGGGAGGLAAGALGAGPGGRHARRAGLPVRGRERGVFVDGGGERGGLGGGFGGCDGGLRGF